MREHHKRAKENQHAACMCVCSLFYYSTPSPISASSSSSGSYCCCCCCCCCRRPCSPRSPHCCSRVLMVLLGCGQPWCVTLFATPAAQPAPLCAGAGGGAGGSGGGKGPVLVCDPNPVLFSPIPHKPAGQKINLCRVL